ncbi:F-box/kelch-repeat protein At3g06240-like [Cornus florida]|uniref:F-box/kelch-repeat protein At3g06240-like n=1 Tax=Cornus florida TaxID=4283 RepID=UPI00289A1455|nr:F-box/kelch-repeat protein At3g06240-like [Cornus florida]
MPICAFLPEEMVVDILSRLPAKCLCRFKCVSKSWFALISSPNFAKTHLNRNDKPKRVFLVSDYFYSIDCTEASNNDDVIAMKLDYPLIKDKDPNLVTDIVASCNGLLLVVLNNLNKRDDYPMYLCNPSTREFKKLPDYNFRFCMYGLGYDSSMDNYKDTFVVVHSLKTSSWRRRWIQDFPYDNSFLLPCSGVFVNGSIHWLTNRALDHSPVIVAFDVADEKFRDVLLPNSHGILLPAKAHAPSGLGVLGGCLFCYKEHDYAVQFDIWVMEEYGVTESWTKFTIYIPDNMYNLEPLCVPLDNELLLKLYDEEMDEDEKIEEDILVMYNVKEKRLRYIMVDGIPLNGYQKLAVTYVESIVSPYFYCGIDRKELSTMTDTISTLGALCSLILDWPSVFLFFSFFFFISLDIGYRFIDIIVK